MTLKVHCTPIGTSGLAASNRPQGAYAARRWTTLHHALPLPTLSACRCLHELLPWCQTTIEKAKPLASGLVASLLDRSMIATAVHADSVRHGDDYGRRRLILAPRLRKARSVARAQSQVVSHPSRSCCTLRPPLSTSFGSYILEDIGNCGLAAQQALPPALHCQEWYLTYCSLVRCAPPQRWHVRSTGLDSSASLQNLCIS